MNGDTAFTVNEVLWFVGVMGTLLAVYKGWKAYVVKKTKQEEAIEVLEKNNEIIMATLLALVNHNIDGNGIEGLKAVRSSLEQYLIKK